MQFLSGARTKRFHVGQAPPTVYSRQASRLTVMSAPVNPLRERAFACLLSPEPELAVKALGEHWETLARVKPYPSCRYSHAALDGVFELRAEHSISEEVEAVEIGLSGWNIIGDPISDKHSQERGRRAVLDAVLYCCGTARGPYGWDDYAKHLSDVDTLALCRKVTTMVDDKVEAEFPRR